LCLYMFQCLMCIPLFNDTHEFSSFLQTRSSFEHPIRMVVKRGTGLSLLIRIFPRLYAMCC
jgi:hypothetical protein